MKTRCCIYFLVLNVLAVAQQKITSSQLSKKGISIDQLVAYPKENLPDSTREAFFGTQMTDLGQKYR